MFIILWFAAVLGLVWFVVANKTRRQAWLDHNRQTYSVVYPHEVHADDIIAFLNSLLGILRRPGGWLLGRPSLVLEVEGTAGGIKFSFRVPFMYAGDVKSQLRGLVPGTVVTREAYQLREWTRATELRETSKHLPLNIRDLGRLVASVLNTLHPLQGEETIRLQAVITPDRLQHLPEQHSQVVVISRRSWWRLLSPPPESKDHTNLMRDKLSEVNFLSVIRIGARADTVSRADHLINRVLSPLASTARASNTLIKKWWLPNETVIRRLVLGSTDLWFPSVLTSTEIAGLTGLPVGKPSVPGLPRGRARQLAADPSIPSEGIIIGESNFDGAERPLAISPADATRHRYTVGPTDSGKSVLMLNSVIQEVQQGYGATVIDPKGDLVTDILDRIPRNRIDDVVLFDPTDSEYPIAFNPLAGDPHEVTEQVLAILDKLFDLRKLSQTTDLLRATLIIMASNNLTLLDVFTFLRPGPRGAAFRERITRGLDLRELGVRDTMEWYMNLTDTDQASKSSPIRHRLSAIETWPSLRAIFGQPDNRLDFDAIISEGKILLVSLPPTIGADTIRFLAAAMINRFYQSAQKRQFIPVADRMPYFMHVDEFQDLMHTPTPLSDVMYKARSLGIGLDLAHQNPSQLTMEIRDAAYSSARSHVYFGTRSHKDADALARECAPFLKSDEFQNMGRFEVVVKLYSDHRMLPPLSCSLLKVGTACPYLFEVVIMCGGRTSAPAIQAISALTNT